MSDPIGTVDCQTGALEVRPPTDDEQAAIADVQATAQQAAAVEQTAGQNRARMSAAMSGAIANLTAAADALDAGTATAAQQRAALALCCRTSARLVRITLEQLDQAT